MLLSTCFLRGKQKCQRSHKPRLLWKKKLVKAFFFLWHLLRLKTFPIPFDDAYRGFFFGLALSAEHLSPTGHTWSRQGFERLAEVREGGSARSELVLPSDGGETERGGRPVW